LDEGGILGILAKVANVEKEAIAQEFLLQSESRNNPDRSYVWMRMELLEF
jgi:hypothetical protein